MKSVYLLFLLVTLLAVISTPANASPLEKKRNAPCCPVVVCEFKKNDNPNISPPVTNPNYYGNTFDGFLAFLGTPKNTLQVGGWIDIRGVTNKIFKTDSGYDIHVAPCGTANTPPEPHLTPGDPATIDFDKQMFGHSILLTIDGSIAQIKGQCCFVVEEYASRGPLSGSKSIPRNERILGIAPLVDIVTC
ncbi:7765_t:CDS:1 [Paraglomus brasilianum]|uniref:7765_t:CDS:1 n=1 Tax=Paraglomus brasilianum TaxID=144538 RepID=A0A9N8Z0R7_9GLOM|nr:7765_t:CDS:1 [Paraglomus brasilianum]